MTPELTAATGDTLGPMLGVAAPSFGPVLLRVGGALVVILILIAGIAMLYRRWLGRESSGVGGSAIRVLNRASLGRRSSLLLVEVDGRRILVGSTATSLSALSEWEEPEELTQTAVVEAYPEKREGFAPLLNRVITKLRAIEGSAS